MGHIAEERDIGTDVVVVGTGFSGLAAAIEGHDAGVEVMILLDRV